MGTTLTGTTPQDTYDSLIKVTDNGPLTGSLKVLTDGLGNDSALALSTGAASVTGTLAVSSDVSIADKIIHTGDTNTAIRFPENDNITFETSGVEAVRVTSVGNVGIGTSTPQHKLDVSGALCVRGFSDSASNYLTFRDTFAPSASGGLGLMAIDHSGAGTDGLAVYGHDGISFYTAQTERMRILSGGGLTFNGDTAQANALDDYEEGTWTGTLRGSVSDPTTAVTATGKYTKIGRLVTVEIQMDGKDTTGASGAVSVTGLPFTSSVEAQGAMMSELYTFGASCTASNCFVSPFSTTLTFFTSGSNVGWAPLTHNAGTPRSLRGTVTYFV